MTLVLDVDFENLTLEQIEDLETLDTLVDEIWNAFEAIDQIDDLADELNDLWDRIEAAGQDPEHLNGETYAELLVDITAMITDNLPIPEALQEAIKAASRLIARFIDFGVGFALWLVRLNFGRQIRAGFDPAEAAKVCGGTKQVQGYLMLWHRQGMPDGGPQVSREPKENQPTVVGTRRRAGLSLAFGAASVALLYGGGQLMASGPTSPQPDPTSSARPAVVTEDPLPLIPAGGAQVAVHSGPDSTDQPGGIADDGRQVSMSDIENVIVGWPTGFDAAGEPDSEAGPTVTTPGVLVSTGNQDAAAEPVSPGPQPVDSGATDVLISVGDDGDAEAGAQADAQPVSTGTVETEELVGVGDDGTQVETEPVSTTETEVGMEAGTVDTQPTETEADVEAGAVETEPTETESGIGEAWVDTQPTETEADVEAGAVETEPTETESGVGEAWIEFGSGAVETLGEGFQSRI